MPLLCCSVAARPCPSCVPCRLLSFHYPTHRRAEENLKPSSRARRKSRATYGTQLSDESNALIPTIASCERSVETRHIPNQIVSYTMKIKVWQVTRYVCAVIHPKLHIWALSLQKYDVDLWWRAGSTNPVPDCLLRLPHPTQQQSHVDDSFKDDTSSVTSNTPSQQSGEVLNGVALQELNLSNEPVAKTKKSRRKSQWRKTLRP